MASTPSTPSSDIRSARSAPRSWCTGWRSRTFAQWRSANASDDPETFRLLAYVEDRIARGDYAHAGVAFDPRKERLVEDTYDEEPKTRALPPHVFAATTRTGVATFAPERRR